MKVTLIMVQSVDGVIARSESDQVFVWTSKEDKQHFVKLTKEIGTLVMGSTTFKSAGRNNYPERKGIVLTSNPDKLELGEGMTTMNGTPAEIYQTLVKAGHDHVALIGGAKVNSSFLSAGLVDEVYLTIEPKLFGKGLHLDDALALDVQLKLVSTTQLNEQGTILLHYKIV